MNVFTYEDGMALVQNTRKVLHIYKEGYRINIYKYIELLSLAFH